MMLKDIMAMMFAIFWIFLFLQQVSGLDEENQFNVRLHTDRLLAPLTVECRELIVAGERQCYARFLDRYDSLAKEIITEDGHSDFDEKICCSTWKWFDCTWAVISDRCRADQVDQFERSLLESFIHSVYCQGYEYGSYYCWPLPFWAYIGFATVAIVLITLGVAFIVWYWRGHQQSTDSSIYRRRQKTNQNRRFLKN